MVITQATHRERPQAEAIRSAARGIANHRFATSNASWRMATPAETIQRKFMAANVLIGVPSAPSPVVAFLYSPRAPNRVNCKPASSMSKHKEAVQKQFTKTADAFSTYAVRDTPEVLAEKVEFIKPQPADL